MATQKKPTDAQLLSRLRRRSSRQATAKDLNTTSLRLREVEGVVEVGRVHSGGRGRPAVLFGLAEDQAVNAEVDTNATVVAA